MGVLDDIFNRQIILNKDEVKRARSIVKDIICRDFINQMKREDKLFNSLYHSIYYTGSFYQGLRISKPDEFDLNVVLNVRPEHFSLLTYKEDESIPHGYARYCCDGNNDNPEKKFFQNGCLSPQLLRNWFKGVFSKALKKFENTYEQVNFFKHTESGPAMTLRVDLNDHGGEICIDLVPVVSVEKNDHIFLVPKPHPSHVLNWRLSYPDVELGILKGKNAPKKVIRFLKLLLQNSNLQKLCSYYMKTLVMLEVDENGSWGHGNVKLFVIKMLTQLQRAMQIGKLPSVHDREMNLISGIDEKIRLHNFDRLKTMISDIKNDIRYDKHFAGAVSQGKMDPSGFYVTQEKDFEEILEEELPPPEKGRLKRNVGIAVGTVGGLAVAGGLFALGAYVYKNWDKKEEDKK